MSTLEAHGFRLFKLAEKAYSAPGLGETSGKGPRCRTFEYSGARWTCTGILYCSQGKAVADCRKLVPLKAYTGEAPIVRVKPHMVTRTYDGMVVYDSTTRTGDMVIEPKSSAFLQVYNADEETVLAAPKQLPLFGGGV